MIDVTFQKRVTFDFFVLRVLQALQVQQQLGAQALSIANQAPQVILSLFK